MKLTNYIRDAFIARALADVPQIDYDEVIRSFVQKSIAESLPPAVQKIWKDSELSAYVNIQFTSFDSVLSNSQSGPSKRNDKPKISQEAFAELKNLRELQRQQSQKINALRESIRGVVYGCTTRKALVELLPEFEKYLPPEEGPINRSLPVVVGLLDNFVAAGWPKSEVKAAPAKKSKAVAA